VRHPFLLPALLIVTLPACAPFWLVRAADAVTLECLFFVESNEPVVALTVDDGPDPVSTPAILDLLEAHDARATFFLISGRVPGNEAVVERLVREGHEIGNHFTSEKPASFRLSADDFERDLLEADAVLARYGNLRWARPADGIFTRSMIETMERHGYRCALGSIYPFDTLRRSADPIATWTLRSVRPGGIIVLHEGGERGERTAEALAEILPELTERGYRVVTLSELAALAQSSSNSNP
jgi:peptidoglycan-N-acetylglucosamine deacetylase